MATKPMVGISRVGQRRQVVIPRGICEDLKLAVGDFVAIEGRAGMVVIRPQRITDRDDVLSRQEGVAVRRGMKDAKTGNIGDWQGYKRTRALGRKAR